ncbi:MAG: SRPBCC family protein [Pseudomonadota bacterium]
MKDNVNKVLTAACAFGAGLLLMYLFDPDLGRRRRTLAADKMRRAGTRAGEMAQLASQDAVNRSRGLLARVRSRFSRRQLPLPTLEERVRARIGHAVSTPGAVEVRAQGAGKVVLSGPLLKRELKNLMAAVWSVPGVEEVENQLQLHDQPGHLPALQGAREASPAGAMFRENWPPSVRTLAGVAGTTLAVAGLVYRPLGLVATLLGGALVARSVGNKSLKRMVGLGGPRSVHIDKEMFIAAPPERVFEFWRRQENFPQFMRHVRDVRPVGEGRWHWQVAGPPGSEVGWDAEITDLEEGRRLAWRTVPGSAAVEHRGRVDFEPEAGGTRLRVSMDYAPAAGVVGHGVTRLFGKDAKTEMDEDLMRLKSFLETGVPPHDAVPQPRPGYGGEPRSLH